jgi:hypothetical protein
MATDDIPFEFIFSTLLFAAILVYSIFFSSAVWGFMLSKVIQLFIQRGHYLHIGMFIVWVCTTETKGETSLHEMRCAHMLLRRTLLSLVRAFNFSQIRER